jgi:hypothetical protein
MCNVDTFENLSNIISVITPLVLLFWFYYSQKQILSNLYFPSIKGKYGCFLKTTTSPVRNGSVSGGLLLEIIDVDAGGNFKGDFKIREIETTLDIKNFLLKEGRHSFFGKIDFKLYRNKKRHPYKPNENRTYIGKIYIVTRLDFVFDLYKIEDYLHAEYDILHYREMQTIVCKLSKIYNEELSKDLPKSFTLYKSTGISYEPYKNLEETIFNLKI